MSLARVVAPKSATGQDTRDRRNCPCQTGRPEGSGSLELAGLWWPRLVAARWDFALGRALDFFFVAMQFSSGNRNGNAAKELCFQGEDSHDREKEESRS